MKIRVMLLTALMSGVWLTLPGLAASDLPLGLDETSMLLKLSEAGGPTLAIVLAIYWLRDSYQRRIDESRAYADSLLTIKREFREEMSRLHERSQAEAARYNKVLEALVERKLQISMKEVIADE